ncbi:17462_t:CDS:1, partial [Gigaspora rosea]
RNTCFKEEVHHQGQKFRKTINRSRRRESYETCQGNARRMVPCLYCGTSGY